MRDRKGKMLAMIVAAVVVMTTLVMLLWNALLPAIFGIKSIGFFQALGLLILCKILFGSFGGRGLFGRHGREMRERWMAMTPEQRDAFINQRGAGRGRGHGCCTWGRGGRGDRHERFDRDDRTDRYEDNTRSGHNDPRDRHDANEHSDRVDPNARHDVGERSDHHDSSDSNKGEKPIDNGDQR